MATCLAPRTGALRGDINEVWERDRRVEARGLAASGIVPAVHIWKELEAAGAAGPNVPEDGRYGRVLLKIRLSARPAPPHQYTQSERASNGMQLSVRVQTHA